MSIIPLRPIPQVLLDTPRGQARLVWALERSDGVRIAHVKMSDTGAPWTFEAHQVRVIKAGAQ